MLGRFAILADLHLGLAGPQLDGMTYGDVSPVVERAIDEVQRHQPDHVILLGDLVNRGYDEEYEHARRLLAPLGNRIIPVIGNHELLRASVADFERHMKVRAFRTETICNLPAIVLNSGVENLPDSQWQGELDDRQLQFLDQTLPTISRDALIIIVHHPLAGTVRISERPMFGLNNSAELQSRLERRGGPAVVLSAHTHAQSFIRAGRFNYLGAPAVSFWPHAFVIVDVEARIMRFSTIRLIENPDDSPDPRVVDPAYRAEREGTSVDHLGIIPLEP